MDSHPFSLQCTLITRICGMHAFSQLHTCETWAQSLELVRWSTFHFRCSMSDVRRRWSHIARRISTIQYICMCCAAAASPPPRARRRSFQRSNFLRNLGRSAKSSIDVIAIMDPPPPPALPVPSSIRALCALYASTLDQHAFCLPTSIIHHRS